MGLQNGERVKIHRAMLLVCDASGEVQAVTSNAADDARGVSFVHKNLADIFGLSSTINRWVTERIQEAREQDEYAAETRLENGDGPVLVKLESLKRDHELYGFALQFSPLVLRDPCALREGDSIVARKQWHEIKNHIGALKLYATFLKRKMPESDERHIVEKIFNGVNALIGYMDRIRRGERQ